MLWGTEHIIFCEVMHWGLGFFIGLSTYLLTLSVVSTSGIKAHFHLGNFSTFLLCRITASGCSKPFPLVTSPLRLIDA